MKFPDDFPGDEIAEQDIPKTACKRSYYGKKRPDSLRYVFTQRDEIIDVPADLTQESVARKLAALAFTPWADTCEHTNLMGHQVKALELLGKYLKMWCEKVESTGDKKLADRMRDALANVARICTPEPKP